MANLKLVIEYTFSENCDPIGKVFIDDKQVALVSSLELKHHLYRSPSIVVGLAENFDFNSLVQLSIQTKERIREYINSLREVSHITVEAPDIPFPFLEVKNNDGT
jgi:hypothetical protein